MWRCEFCRRILTANASQKCDKCYRKKLQIDSIQVAKGWFAEAVDEVMTNERKNITQPPDWWLVFESEAKKAGMSLSEWIGEACVQRLPNKERKKLSERPPANRPKKKQQRSE